MSEIYIITAAAAYLALMAAIGAVPDVLSAFIFKFCPAILAFGLGIIATAKFMGWPL